MTNDQRRVCVVSLIGKSEFHPNRNKAWKLNSLVQKNIFKSDPKLKEKFLKKVKSTDEPATVHEETQLKPKPLDSNIQTYYDQKNRVIYVHLESIFDTNNIYEQLIRNQSSDDQKGFFEQWESEQLKYLKSVLLIFSISHIVIISNPSCELDITYIRLFRLIDTLRNKLMPSLVELLKSLELPIGKDWIYAARPCSPRVLFAFENCPRHLLSDPYSSQGLEKLQHSLEDQIYNSLRKSYVITNISNNSIFAIPANQEFVYVHRVISESANINKLLMSNPNKPMSGVGYQCFASASSSFSKSSTSTPDATEIDAKLFREFVFGHIRTALSDGFNDNIGRTNVAPVFELPTCDVWYKLYDALVDFFLTDTPKSSKIAAYYSQLKSQIDLDVQFSENRCKKLIPSALGLYQENLPAYYNKHQHQQRLDKALALYHTNARGPMYNHYLDQLKRECSNIWLNGRQLCEAVSLTGHNCVLELHRVPVPSTSEIIGGGDEEPIAPTETESATTASEKSEDENTPHRRLVQASEIEGGKRSRGSRTVSGRGAAGSSSGEMKVKAHTSNIVTLAASNCGEFQRERKDPFELKEANYSFYEDFSQLSSVIERQDSFVRYEFPVFKPSILNAKPAEKSFTNMPPNPTPQSTQQLSVNANLSQDNNNNTNSKSPLNISESSSNQVEKAQPSNEPSNRTDAVTISTEVYLTGMTHSDSPIGLLPRFSSWSLVSIGKYADYNAHIGLTQPGFMPSQNYLIPWEIVVANNTVTSLHDKPSSRKNPVSRTTGLESDPRLKRTTGSSVTLRAYIGVEYECPCGHRFICSAPDRVVKLSNNGVVKDDAYKLLNVDMPLYTACPCRKSKDSTPYMAQLMRVFIVTPPGKIQPDDSTANSCYLNISIRPRVQPNPPPCPIFWPSQQDPIVLEDNCFWILRLPYIYMGDDGKPYSRPTDFETLNSCKVLKGMFSVSLINTS